MKPYLILVFFAFMTLTACNRNVLFDSNESVNEKGWSMYEKIIFELDIKDTVSKYNFALNLRHTTDYQHPNIVFFITTIYPDHSVTQKDTIECYLATPDGNWIGKGNGKIKDNRFWFARSVRFPQIGRYTFEIEQATRDTNLTGVSDIGLHIEKPNTTK
ncbi:MAG: gliding motility lipoprotein GldH [Bacteroidales bacterium]|jgi:gliding motility-associated lipoprotein GldH|nr:gliding motility lipoprotein GldH [Bacteroidales bacterium]